VSFGNDMIIEKGKYGGTVWVPHPE